TSRTGPKKCPRGGGPRREPGRRFAGTGLALAVVAAAARAVAARHGRARSRDPYRLDLRRRRTGERAADYPHPRTPSVGAAARLFGDPSTVARLSRPGQTAVHAADRAGQVTEHDHPGRVRRPLALGLFATTPQGLWAARPAAPRRTQRQRRRLPICRGRPG